jgi:hypothetical protein
MREAWIQEKIYDLAEETLRRGYPLMGTSFVFEERKEKRMVLNPTSSPSPNQNIHL